MIYSRHEIRGPFNCISVFLLGWQIYWWLGLGFLQTQESLMSVQHLSSHRNVLSCFCHATFACSHLAELLVHTFAKHLQHLHFERCWVFQSWMKRGCYLSTGTWSHLQQQRAEIWKCSLQALRWWEKLILMVLFLHQHPLFVYKNNQAKRKHKKTQQPSFSGPWTECHHSFLFPFYLQPNGLSTFILSLSLEIYSKMFWK